MSRSDLLPSFNETASSLNSSISFECLPQNEQERMMFFEYKSKLDAKLRRNSETDNENERRLTRVVQHKRTGLESEHKKYPTKLIQKADHFDERRVARSMLTQLSKERQLDESEMSRDSINEEFGLREKLSETYSLSHLNLPQEESRILQDRGQHNLTVDFTPCKIRSISDDLNYVPIRTPPILKELDWWLDQTSPSKYDYENYKARTRLESFYLTKQPAFTEVENKSKGKSDETFQVDQVKYGGCAFKVNPPTPKKPNEEEVEIPVLLLKLFENPPYVNFNNVKVGDTKIVILMIRNPSNNSMCINSIRLPRAKMGFEVNMILPAFIEGKMDFECEITWTPKESGKHRESIYFECGNRQKFQTIILGEAFVPKTKNIKIKGVKRPLYKSVAVTKSSTFVKNSKDQKDKSSMLEKEKLKKIAKPSILKKK